MNGKHTIMNPPPPPPKPSATPPGPPRPPVRAAKVEATFLSALDRVPSEREAFVAGASPWLGSGLAHH